MRSGFPANLRTREDLDCIENKEEIPSPYFTQLLFLLMLTNRFSELGTRDGSDTTVPAKEKEHYKQSPPQDEQLPPAKIKRRRKKKD